MNDARADQTTPTFTIDGERQGRLVLVTNDDGIDSVGLHTMALTLQKAGCRVVVAAPQADMSGAAAAIGPVKSSVPVRTVTLPGIDAAAYAVDAPPALIVVSALQGVYGPPPDIVVAGINAGVNLGRAIVHSGTVGAAITAQNLGVPAMAVSLEPGGSFDHAAAIAMTLADELYTDGEHVPMLNVNVPAGATATTEVRTTTLARFGEVSAALVDDALSFQVVIDPANFAEPGSDGAAIREGFASVTRLLGFIGPAPAGPAEVITRSAAPPPEKEPA